MHEVEEGGLEHGNESVEVSRGFNEDFGAFFGDLDEVGSVSQGL